MDDPDNFQTYIDIAWQAHAEKLEELNGLLYARQVIDEQVNRATRELEALAEEAGQALPWTLAGPFDNWHDAEKAEAYWAMQGKANLKIIEA